MKHRISHVIIANGLTIVLILQTENIDGMYVTHVEQAYYQGRCVVKPEPLPKSKWLKCP